MRQKRHFMLMAFGMIFLFFIAGCDRGRDTPGGAPTTPFLGGSQGLEIGFIDGSPPDEVTDDDFDFQVIVGLKNLGESEKEYYDVYSNPKTKISREIYYRGRKIR